MYKSHSEAFYKFTIVDSDFVAIIPLKNSQTNILADLAVVLIEEYSKRNLDILNNLFLFYYNEFKTGYEFMFDFPSLMKSESYDFKTFYPHIDFENLYQDQLILKYNKLNVMS